MTLVEWKSLLLVQNTKSFDDLDNCSFQVHCVEVKESYTSVNELLALLDTKLDTIFANFFVIIFNWFDGVTQKLWHVGLAEVNSSHESIIAKDGHKTRNYFLGNTSSSAVFDPLKINFTVIEELCNDNISTSITFFFEILDVIISICLSHVHLWITGNNNAEVVSVSLSDEGN